jgi:hypothetical protein
VLPHSTELEAGVSVQLEVPLQVRVMQVSELQVSGVPWHVPPEQVSPYVQAFPSSQAALVRHCHVPPALVQRYTVPPQVTLAQEFPALQAWVVPAHVPEAPFAPHPPQVRLTSSEVVPHTSGHVPGAVLQPLRLLHWTWQQPEAVQDTSSAVHVQELHVPDPLQNLVQFVG